MDHTDTPDPVIDRRAAIEAAFEKVEEPTTSPIEPAPKPPAEGAPAEPDAGAPPPPPAEKSQGQEQEPSQPQKTYAVDKPPQSWRGPQKAKWAALDVDVRQEVIRREREHERVLGDTAVARQIAGGFNQVVQPYMARIQALGVHPLVAAQELFKADHVLTTSPPRQRAQYMAKLIQEYGIDIQELDTALSGQGGGDPKQAEIDRLLQERLAPFQRFIQDQTESNKRTQQQTAQEMHSSIEAMAEDPKYPEFDDVRQDMADVIEIQAKKGVYLTLEQAYTRAIAMNPEVAARVQKQTQTAQQSAAAKAADARARQAKAASVSVGGAPNGTPSGTTIVNDRRATIAAALDQVSGR